MSESEGYRRYFLNEEECEKVRIIYENVKAYVKHIHDNGDDFYDCRKSKFLFFKEKEIWEFNKQRAGVYVDVRGLGDFFSIRQPFMYSEFNTEVVCAKGDFYKPLYDVYPMMMLEDKVGCEHYCLLTPDQCEFMRRVQQGCYDGLLDDQIFDVFAYLG